MALSKEYQYYHLTPKGWISGSFEGDALGGSYQVAIPEDRVLTILFIDEIPAPKVKPIYRTQVDWQSDNVKDIRRLKEEFGELPEYVQNLMSRK